MNYRYQNIEVIKSAATGSEYYVNNIYPEIPPTNDDNYIITVLGDRLDWYLDYPITDVYGLIPEYIKFRENFTNTYTNLLADVVPDDEVLEDADEIKEQKREQQRQKFAWESTIRHLDYLQLCFLMLGQYRLLHLQQPTQ